MRILLATDAFPPVCGGSGWSTYELSRGLRARGHAVSIVQPRPGTTRTVSERTYDQFRVIEYGVPVPPVPYLRNYFKNERLYADLANFLTRFMISAPFTTARIRSMISACAATDVTAVAKINGAMNPCICLLSVTVIFVLSLLFTSNF